MGKRIPRDKRLFVANDMPPLYRTQPGQPYNYKTDNVYEWMAKRPTLMSYLFDKLSLGGYIEFNQETGTWQGVDYED